ncbi:type II 3-dehydroquinate dehydratase [Amycolatopsis sp. MEPSY49]|uniref:type II 3-dehydroquinate dehydratase n=1 Tax=Amycolatopsis sp. MEPSY49 TaxID=3151600 RepID=UPI003EF5C8EF
MKFLIMHGPNINRLGKRWPEKYGHHTLADITADVDTTARALGVEVDHVQSNTEGDLVGWLHDRQDTADGVVLNPAGLTYYGWSLHDGLHDAGLPIAIVHIGQFWAYERGRRPDIFAELATIHLTGAGWRGYQFALRALHGKISAA